MKPKLTTSLRNEDIDPSSMTDKVAVLIDVLGATSVISHALKQGASAVHIVHCEMDAQRRALSWSGRTSASDPLIHYKGANVLDLLKQTAKGQQLVLPSSSCNAIVQMAGGALHLYAGALLNASAVVQQLLSYPSHTVTFLCASPGGKLSLIDLFTAGYMIEALSTQSPGTWQVAENSKVAVAVFHEYRDNPQQCLVDCLTLRPSTVPPGLDGAEYLSQINTHDCVPEHNGQGVFMDSLAMTFQGVSKTQQC